MRYALIISPALECFTEILMSVKSSSSRMRTSSSADSTSASADGRPCFSRSERSSDPALTPMRMGTPRAFASAAISRTLSWYLMFPGLMRRPWMPASNAIIAYRHWKWMSAITGIVACSAICWSAAASSRWGTATRTISQPAATRAAICCKVALTSAVFVVVMDWTRTGASPPTSTQPTRTFREVRRSVPMNPVYRPRIRPPGRADLLERVRQWPNHVEVEQRDEEQQQEGHDQGRDRQQAAHIDPALGELLHADDGQMPAVQGRQRQQVQQADEDVEAGEEEEQHIEGPRRDRLPGEAGRPHPPGGGIDVPGVPPENITPDPPESPRAGD